jgi:hypothetical protein
MVPAPIGRKAGRPWRVSRTLTIAVGLCCIGMLMAGGMVWGLEAKRQERIVEMANELVAAKVEAARPLLVERDWDSAIALLEDALAMERATELAEAECLLDSARRGRADDLALRQRRLDEERAEALRRQAEAQAYAVRQRALEARRQAEAELRAREARVRGTPLFQEVLAFIKETRDWHRESQNDALLAYLFRELGVKDAGEQEKLRAEVLKRSDEQQILGRRIAKMRTRIKTQLALLSGFDQRDRELFSKMMNQELDQLLKETSR